MIKVNKFLDQYNNKFFFTNDIIYEIVDISKKISSLKNSKIIIKIINAIYNRQSIITSYPSQGQRTLGKISIIPYMINLCPNTNLQIIIQAKKIFDICRMSIISQYNNDKYTVPIIDIKYIYYILTNILMLIIIKYITITTVPLENTSVEHRILSNILKDNIDLNLSSCNIVVHWISRLIQIFNDNNNNNDINELENLLLHCHNCDINLLKKNQVKECLMALKTKKILYLRMLLVLVYEISHIFNNYNYQSILDWYNNQKINNLSELQDFLQNPLNETLLFLANSITNCN